MQRRAIERAVADNGELQGGNKLGKSEVKIADYFLEHNIVTASHNSGGGGAGAVVGGINVKKGEASATLSVVNPRSI